MSVSRGDSYKTASFSLRNRVARALWHCCWLVLFWPSPRPLHAWRALLLRLWGAKLGRNCHIYPKAAIWAPWNLVCGDEVGVADDVNLYNQEIIRLGRRCVISQGSYLSTGTHDYTSPSFPLVAKPIIVEDFA